MPTLDPIWPEPSRPPHSEETQITLPTAASETLRLQAISASEDTHVPGNEAPAPDATTALPTLDALDAQRTQALRVDAAALEPTQALIPDLKALEPTVAIEKPLAAEKPTEALAKPMEAASQSSRAAQALAQSLAQPSSPATEALASPSSLRGLELKALPAAAPQTSPAPAPAPSASRGGFKTFALWSACVLAAAGVMSWLLLRPRGATTTPSAGSAPVASPVAGPVAPSRMGLPEDMQMKMAAADRGDVHAMRYLGACYTYGLGVSKDPAKGLEWYRKAAATGDQAAQKELTALGAGQQASK